MSKILSMRLPDLMTPQEVATALRVSRATVSNWARDGVLQPVTLKAGAKQTIRFRREDIQKLLESTA